ncbi:uncharacterized protein LOC126055383 [Helicoverpa armigera]|uniref:Uncharacterized protein n=1 Tax=Helicoverpa armigera TaxID=29058 RepID=A0A2W1BRU6_HELAM|nr:uncharacterized protein LOC124636499 [Helicoverpa zea]XP_049700291.1 uncharacterized protein LOC126055383 [Helicoverpa armigera]PZC77799.1 hypothetical protein B5X24_HaOG202989 [Helicoverpa armigera]
MATKRPPIKKPRELVDKAAELPEVALAAIASYKKQKEVGDFINFLLAALERNSNWLNTLVGRQNNFRCALMVGAGPNRFQLQEIIYPSGGSDIKLEVELKDSEDHDKIAIAALVKLTNIDLEHLLKYIKTRLCDNTMLREDLLKGKALGVSFAVLRPFSDKQYRVMERIVIGSSMKCVVPMIKKRRRDEKIVSGPPFKKTRKVT